MKKKVKNLIIDKIIEQLQGERIFNSSMDMNDAQIADCAVDISDDIIEGLIEFGVIKEDEVLGYYAKDKDNNLHQYEWGADDEFSILNDDGDYVMVNPKDYKIVQLGIISEEVIKVKEKVRKWELIGDMVEINEDFLPNSDLTYTIEFDGVDKFKAHLEQGNFDRKMVGVENAPKVLHYTLNRPIDELTQADKECILHYRGLNGFTDEVFPIDVFMEKSHITFEGGEMEVVVMSKFEGESCEDFLTNLKYVFGGPQ